MTALEIVKLVMQILAAIAPIVAQLHPHQVVTAKDLPEETVENIRKLHNELG